MRQNDEQEPINSRARVLGRYAQTGFFDYHIWKKQQKEKKQDMGNTETKSRNESVRRAPIKWTLIIYDIGVIGLSYILVFGLLGGARDISVQTSLFNFATYIICIFVSRFLGKVYSQILRYGGIQVYIRLIFFDAVGFFFYFIISRQSPFDNIPLIRMLAFVSTSNLGSLMLRMVYRYAFKTGTYKTKKGRFLLWLLKVFAHISNDAQTEKRKINVAILGAGNIGVSLAQELMTNKDSIYEPVCFIDVSKEKAGRQVFGLRVLEEENTTAQILKDLEVQEVIFTVTNISNEKRQELYTFYKNAGCKVRVYDSPQMEKAGKTRFREFSVEELLFRRQQFVVDEATKAYYRDKIILITGGGGSIGSEICRQLAKMNPKKLIVLDVYENGAYDVQQELRIKYKGALDLQVEICSITDIRALERVFEAHRPQIVINAAAHKHVPLMEHNCIEAIENNVFGCKNVLDCCEKYQAERFMMVSTDKAVNPTNVMGATKRMCEMIAQSVSTKGTVKCSATRFGNVLGSAGSVIPLFRKQISQGGPITLTDKRIIRYFMTIPEASQLVLASGAMANNGDLFVLDMGEPVKILDLAESMIRLMGAQNIEIQEIGLRPGEKLYEELLIKTENLDKTSNKLIFIEHDAPLSPEEIDSKLITLKQACESGNDDSAREALRSVVPTFKRPEEVNEAVGK